MEYCSHHSAMIERMLAGDKAYLLRSPRTTTATSAAPAASFKRSSRTVDC
jgi:hypothetical protein